MGYGKASAFFSEKGFSLIEVLITAAIMAIGLLAMAQMQIVAIRSNADTRAHTEATNLAIGQIEYLKNLAFTCPAGMKENDYWLTDPAGGTGHDDIDGTDTDLQSEDTDEYDVSLCGESTHPDHMHPDYPVDSWGYPKGPSKERYGMFWNIEDHESEPLKTVTVTVTWYGGHHRTKKHVTLSTVVANQN